MWVIIYYQEKDQRHYSESRIGIHMGHWVCEFDVILFESSYPRINKLHVDNFLLIWDLIVQQGSGSDTETYAHLKNPLNAPMAKAHREGKTETSPCQGKGRLLISESPDIFRSLNAQRNSICRVPKLNMLLFSGEFFNHHLS